MMITFFKFLKKSCLKSIFLFGFFLLTSLVFANVSVAGVTCHGRVINPTSICWRCLFPITIGKTVAASGNLPDTPNRASPVCTCGNHIPPRLGIDLFRNLQLSGKLGDLRDEKN